MTTTLDELVRAIVREELRASTRDEYYAADHLPPGFTSAEAFAAVCRRLGLSGECKSGRSWRVPSQLWHEARRKRPKLPTTDEERALALLDGNPKLRIVGGKR